MEPRIYTHSYIYIDADIDTGIEADTYIDIDIGRNTDKDIDVNIDFQVDEDLDTLAGLPKVLGTFCRVEGLACSMLGKRAAPGTLQGCRPF